MFQTGRGSLSKALAPPPGSVSVRLLLMWYGDQFAITCSEKQTAEFHALSLPMMLAIILPSERMPTNIATTRSPISFPCAGHSTSVWRALHTRQGINGRHLDIQFGNNFLGILNFMVFSMTQT